MFVYVRLIDSQEHQYPNKKPDPTIQRKTKKQDPEKPIVSKIQEKTKFKKDQCSWKPFCVPESFNWDKSKNPIPLKSRHPLKTI